MKQVFEYPYNGARLTRAQTISTFEAIAGTITDISINAPNAPSTGDYIFNVQLNGENLFSAGGRFTINAANERVEKNALTIETEEADILAVTIEAVGQAGLLAPIFVLVTIDDGVEVEADIAGEVHAATAKTTPVNNDEFALVDSAASNVLKKLTWSNIKATLKTYFDTLYQAVLTSGTNIKTINSQSLLGSGNLSISGGASDLDDLTDVAITSPTTGQVLKFNGTNWVNGTDSTGGGGSGGELDGLFPITSPGNVADYSWLNQNAATASTRGNAILLKETVSVSLSLPMLVKTLPSAPHVFTLGFRCWTDLADTGAGAGLVLYESGSGKFITVRFLPSGATLAQVDLWNSFTSYNSTVLASNPPEFSKLKDFIFVRVRDTGTTRYYETSFDGDEWRSMFSHSSGTFITPDKAGFLLAQQSGDVGGMTVISLSIE